MRFSKHRITLPLVTYAPNGDGADGSRRDERLKEEDWPTYFYAHIYFCVSKNRLRPEFALPYIGGQYWSGSVDFENQNEVQSTECSLFETVTETLSFVCPLGAN